jgi:ferredoxin
VGFTPFGIRDKLKQRLGMGRPERQIVKHRITYLLPDGSERTIEAEEHYSVLMASEALEAPISTGRRAGGTCPDGGCAACRVEVLDGSGLTPRTDAELRSMEALAAGEPHEGRARKPGPPIEATSRLSCYAKIVGPGARVRVYELFDFDSIRGDPEGT